MSCLIVDISLDDRAVDLVGVDVEAGVACFFRAALKSPPEQKETLMKCYEMNMVSSWSYQSRFVLVA